MTGRVLRSLDAVHRDLAFWRNRLSEGQHRMFLLLGQVHMGTDTWGLTHAPNHVLLLWDTCAEVALRPETARHVLIHDTA